MQSLELLLDPATDARLRAEWLRLIEAGLPSQARHPGETNAPHITLAVAQELPAELEPGLTAAAGVLPLPVRLGSLVVFGSRRLILSRLVVPDAALLALHDAVAEVVGRCPGVPDLLRPGAWTPHVTLARGLSPATIGEAITALGQVPPLEARAVGARRWDSVARRAWMVGAGAGGDATRAEPSDGPPGVDSGR